MPRATHTLLPRTKSFKPVGVSAIHIFARLAAKKAIQEKLRADGVRLTPVPPRVISEQAQRYLTDHADELYPAALERAKRMGLIKPMPIMVTPDPLAETPLCYLDRWRDCGH